MLKEEICIGNSKLNNRIVMPPMATSKSTPEGFITPELIDYYRQRAVAGTGLIITEHAYISEEGKASPNQVSVSKDEDIEGLRKLADEIHHCSNTKIIVQINHAGSLAKPDVSETGIIAPSAVVHPRRKDGMIPKEMNTDDIEKVIYDFVQAAKRVQEAGFDGVEIHGAHGYLLNQFYSPLTNKRTDAYGGCLENRIRIHCQILDAVRKETGKDFMISIRLGGVDYLEGGSTVEDSVQASVLFEKHGADIISVTGGLRGYINPDDATPGYFRDMSVPVKQAVKISVLLTGGINTPEEAEAVLQEGYADLAGIGRAMLKDPDWSSNA
ncbi:MAG: NADH:flavin oxidoreductase [Solobacterium sp.]|nr:NADH:flavin oxidoreductase [Solobacterium sp.]